MLHSLAPLRTMKRSAEEAWAWGDVTKSGCLFPGPALSIIVKKGFLGHEELLLLGQTSKHWHATISDDAVWADFVHTRWANIVNRLPSVLVAARREEHGYRDLCRRLTLKIEDENYEGKVSPASLRACDLILLAELTCNGRLVASHVAEDIAPLVEGKPLSIDLFPCDGPVNDSIVLGSVLPDDDGLFHLEPGVTHVKAIQTREWKMKVQLLRKCDGKMCTVFETDEIYVEYPPGKMQWKRIDLDPIDIDVIKKDHLEAYLNFRSGYTGLAMSGKGLHLLKTITQHLYVDAADDDTSVDGFHFDVQSNLAYPKCPRYFGLDETLRDFKNSIPGGGWFRFCSYLEEHWKNARRNEKLSKYFDMAENERQEMVATFKRIEITAHLSIHEGGGQYGEKHAGSHESGIASHGVGFLHLVDELKGWH